MVYATLPVPPANALRLSSDDPDEVTSWVAGHDGYHSRVVHGSGPYGFRLARIRTPTVQVGWARTELANTLRASFRQPTFHLPVAGMQHYTCGRRQLAAEPGTMVFVAAGTEVTRHCDSMRMIAIEVDAAAIEREFAHRQVRGPVELQRVPRVLEKTGSQWREVFEALGALAHSHAAPAAAAGIMHGEARVLNALVSTLIGFAGSSSMRPAPRRLQLLEEWIESHLGEAITLGRLCEVARVSQRSMQVAFQARRGMSPMRFVCERRLAAVQRQLMRAESGDNVTSIATRLGFTHLGRFSSAYAQVFGESPSMTRIRARGSRPPRADAPRGRDGEVE